MAPADLVRPILTSGRPSTMRRGAWNLLRNPLPPRTDDGLFDRIYQDLDIDGQAEDFTDRSYTDLDDFTRDDLRDALRSGTHGIGFFQYHNPISRHVVLRRRRALEDAGLMTKIAIDMWPNSREPNLRLFENNAVRTSADFDHAYAAVEKFARRWRTGASRGPGFMRNLLRQRICSSVASGLSTCRTLADRKAPARWRHH